MSEEDVQVFPDSRQVNAADMAIIAFWCGGAVRSIHGSLCVQVTKDDFALVGDWIVRYSDRYEVYKDEAYQTLLATWGRDTEKFKKILALVKTAMLEQDAATYHQSTKDMRLVAEKIARTIIELD